MLRRSTVATHAARATALLLVLASAGAGVAVAARAGSDGKLRAQFISGTNAAGIAECSGNQRATGGGVLGLHAADGSTVIESGPLDETGGIPETENGDKPHSWFAFQRAGDSRQYKVYAICSKSSDAKIRTAPLDVDGGEGDVTVFCPQGQTALGGGALFDQSQAGDTGVLRMESNGPVDSTGLASETEDGDRPRQWIVSMENPTGPQIDMTAYAVCSKSTKAKLEVTEFTMDGGQQDGQVAVCPRGKRVLGGGVVPSSPTGSAWIQTNGPRGSSFTTEGTDSGDVPTNWYASVIAIGGDDEEFKVLAVCG